MATSGMPEAIGAYRIGQEIGRGGMGIVYRARDTRLDRDVAVKVLPDDLLGDPERIARFEREARTLALLNHPNIAQIYGIEEQDGRRFLVLEYVEGETLEDRLGRGPLALEEAVEIGLGICHGLEAAHGAGVIHRDLKPANVKLMRDGKVKVLDLGLAKAAESPQADPDLVESPTRTSPTPHSPTIPGAILGTAPYMSPEQARGRDVDKRTDIWSFGVVLYEMLTGTGPFLGETVSDSIAAILHKDVDHDLLPAGTPAVLRSVLRRCLERDRDRRLHDIADARIELEETGGVEPDAPVVSRAASPRSVAIVVVAAVALLAGAMFLGRVTAPGIGDDTAPLHAQLSPLEGSQIVYYGDVAGPAQVSPDGSQVVFTAQDEHSPARLWLRPLAARDPRALDGTEGASFPFWSPDSRSIGFFADGKLRRVDLETGSTYTVCDAPSGRGGTWTSTGEILFSPNFQSPIHRVPAAGGEPAALTEIDATRHTSHRWPYALADGRHFIFSAVHHDVTRAEPGDLMLGSLAGGAPRRILRSQYRAEVVDGLLLYTREGTLMAAPLDVDGARLADDSVPLVPGVIEDASTWHAGFSASPAGVLAYHRSGADDTALPANISAAVECNVTEVRDRGGRLESTVAADVPQFSGSSLSPAGDVLAVSALESGQDDFDIWLYPTGYERTLEPGEAVDSRAISRPTRLASAPGAEAGPVWSPDGRQIAYGRIWGEDARLGIHTRTLGGGDEKLLLAQGDDGQIWPLEWTRDGRWLIVNRGFWVSGGAGDIMLLPADGGDLTPLVATDAYEADAKVSPDGRWLAYVSAAESDVFAVYVIPFAPAWPELTIDPSAPSPRWRVSVAGGMSMAWSRDGTELYFGCPSDGTTYSAPVDTTGDVFRHGPPTPLFRHIWNAGTLMRVLELDSGPRFFISDVKQLTDEPISVVLNWQGLLDRRTR